MKLKAVLILGFLLLFSCSKRESSDITGEWEVSSITVILPLVDQWFGFSTKLTEYKMSGATIKTKLQGTLTFTPEGTYNYNLSYQINSKLYEILPLDINKENFDSGTYVKSGDTIQLTSTQQGAKPFLPKVLVFRIDATRLMGSKFVLEEHPDVVEKDNWFIRMVLSEGGEI